MRFTIFQGDETTQIDPGTIPHFPPSDYQVKEEGIDLDLCQLKSWVMFHGNTLIFSNVFVQVRKSNFVLDCKWCKISKVQINIP